METIAIAGIWFAWVLSTGVLFRQVVKLERRTKTLVKFTDDLAEWNRRQNAEITALRVTVVGLQNAKGIS